MLEFRFVYIRKQNTVTCRSTANTKESNVPFSAMAAILVMCSESLFYFHSPFLRMLHMAFGFDWPNGFREEDL